MQFFTTAILALAAAAGALATPTQTTTATYSTAYDVGDASLNSVACSNGANGLLTKGQLFFLFSQHCLLSIICFRFHHPQLAPPLPLYRWCTRRLRLELPALRFLLAARLQGQDHHHAGRRYLWPWL